MKIKKKNKIFSFIPTMPSIVAILAICFFVVASFAICHFYKSDKTESVGVNSSNETNQTGTEPATNSDSTSTINSTAVKQNISTIPILMYHHIRDYNDPNDKIGTNLSVSPQKLSEQLDYIKSKGYTTITFKDLQSNKIPEKPIIITFDDGYQNFYQNAFPLFRDKKMTAVSFVIYNFIGKSDYMDASEIKKINDYGIEVGSHTLSHPDLTKITADKAKTEIENSKVGLEALLGGRIISFCYPSGKFSDATELLVKEAGYSYAVTTKSGIGALSNPLILDRYRLNSDTNINGIISK